ncbi:MAG TPA: hypothetical protein VND91_01385 [Candidatus Saccharimonadia bacterium]|nr:hypothetical protein [Candidatus Saccharimonadia bacterium]
MDWRAVGYGIVAGLVVFALQVVIAFVVPLERFPGLLTYVIVANQLLSVATYAVAGAVAGKLARRAGALHGMLAGFGIAIAGRILGALLNYVRHGIEGVQASWAEPATIAVMLFIGVVVASVAGGIAKRLVLRRPASAPTVRTS